MILPSIRDSDNAANSLVAAVLLRTPGLMRSMAVPRRSHQTDNLLKPNRACALAQGFWRYGAPRWKSSLYASRFTTIGPINFLLCRRQWPTTGHDWTRSYLIVRIEHD